MTWFDQIKQALPAYYPPTQPRDIVGYLQGAASPGVWRQMAQGPAPRHQMIVLGSVPPSREEWQAAGVAQRGQVQTITLSMLQGWIVLYGGFMLRPWGSLHELTGGMIPPGFQSSLDSWRRNYMPPRHRP